MQVLRLEVRGGRQDKVGVARGVGQERIVNDGEEVLAREAAAHRLRVRARHRGVVGGDVQRADRGSAIVSSASPSRE